MSGAESRKDHAEIGRSAGKIGAATFLSHIFGLIRDQIFAYLFGTSLFADAFNLAFSVPTFFRRLFGEGVMNSAFVPVFTQHRIAEGEEESNCFGSNALIALSILILVSVGIGVLIAPVLLHFYAAGWREEPARMEAAVRLTRILFPYLIFVAPAVLIMGILNALRHFTVPALSPVVFNIGILAAALAAMKLPDRGTDRIDLFCVGVLIGSLGQLLIQLPALRWKKFHFRPNLHFNTPEFRAVGSLMLPGVVGLAVIQVNILVDTFFATQLVEGSVTALRMGNRVMLLPLAIFATAVASASLPSLSAQAAKNGIERVKETLGYTLRLLLFLLIPSTVGLIVLREGIIRVLFVRGAFDDGGYSLAITSSTLMLYSIGLFAYGGIKGVSQFFFSFRDTRTPVIVGTLAMVVNVFFDFLLYRPFAVGGLALATSIAGIVNFLLLFYMLVRRYGAIREGRIFNAGARILASALVMGVAVRYVSGLLEPTDPGPLAGQLVHIGGSILAGLLVYVGVASLLCRRELEEVRSALLRRRALP